MTMALLTGFKEKLTVLDPSLFLRANEELAITP